MYTCSTAAQLIVWGHTTRPKQQQRESAWWCTAFVTTLPRVLIVSTYLLDRLSVVTQIAKTTTQSASTMDEAPSQAVWHSLVSGNTYTHVFVYNKQHHDAYFLTAYLLR